MTSRSVSPPTPEPDQGANSAQNAEIRGRPRRELLCDRCKRDYPVWFTTNEVWNAVVRAHGGDGYGDEPDRDVFLCPLCFVMLAEVREPGAAPTGWFVTPEGLGPDVFLRTIRERDDARASLRSLESALPEGSVTPEERRTRAGEAT